LREFLGLENHDFVIILEILIVTILVREFCWMCRAETQTYLDGYGDMNDHVTPYFAWRRIFSQLFKFNLVNRNNHETDTSHSISSSSSDTDLRFSNSSAANKYQDSLMHTILRQIESLPPAIACWTPLLQPIIPELQGIVVNCNFVMNSAYITPEMVDVRRLKRETIAEKTLELLLYLLQESTKDNQLVIIMGKTDKAIPLTCIRQLTVVRPK
jgi:hypothetical protein